MELYGELLEIGGGKERMTKYFTVRGGQCRVYCGGSGLNQWLEARETFVQ